MGDGYLALSAEELTVANDLYMPEPARVATLPYRAAVNAEATA